MDKRNKDEMDKRNKDEMDVFTRTTMTHFVVCDTYHKCYIRASSNIIPRKNDILRIGGKAYWVVCVVQNMGKYEDDASISFLQVDVVPVTDTAGVCRSREDLTIEEFVSQHDKTV